MKIRAMIKRAALLTAAFCMTASMMACGSKKSDGIEESKSGEVVEGGEQYEQYVMSIMNANYKDDLTDYISLTGASQEDAEAIYTASTQNLGLKIENALSVKQDVVTLDITQQMIDMAKTIYSQAQYETVAVMSEDDTYTVSIQITPIDFWGTVDATFEAAVDTWNEQVKEGSMDNMSDSEYEEAYGANIAAAVVPLAAAMQYEDPVTVYITLEYDSTNDIYQITDEDMEALGEKVVDMTHN